MGLAVQGSSMHPCLARGCLDEEWVGSHEPGQVSEDDPIACEAVAASIQRRTIATSSSACPRSREVLVGKLLT